jgi:hypothetical protein
MINSTSSRVSLDNSWATSEKAEKRAARNSKKRRRSSVTLLKPASQPNVSPNFRPSIFDHNHSRVSFRSTTARLDYSIDITDAAHARILASKSNYRNILDGTVIPGVLYPASFCAGLASKRTSHKLAEQERRERLNKALENIQALLPSLPAEGDVAKTSNGRDALPSDSKAEKIENATEYIRRLKQQISEKNLMICAKDQEIDRLKRELAIEK